MHVDILALLRIFIIPVHPVTRTASYFIFLYFKYTPYG